MPSIRNFISRLPRSLADTFLHRHKVALGPDVLARSDQAIADAIDTALDGLPPGTRRTLEHDIELVERLSTPNGERAIDDASVGEGAPDLPSRQARALWIFLNDSDSFRRAEEIVYNDDHRQGKLWTSFRGEKGRDVRRDPSAQEEFMSALRVLFDSANVHIEIFDRARPAFFGSHADTETNGDGTSPLVQITIYREDRPNAEPVFVDGKLTMQTRRQVLEAAVTYDASTGSIECVAPYKANREEIAQHFATALLGCSPDVRPIANRYYDLTPLRLRRQLETDPEDRIENVSISMLRLQPVETQTEQIFVERWWKSDRDIWSIADERLGEKALEADYNITQAKIVVRYRSEESNRLRSLAVTITHPDRSTIKDQREIDRLVANKYLPRWGIAPSA
jgi:hypothetical protein